MSGYKIDISQADIAYVEEKLGTLKSQAPTVIKRAVTRTARNAVSILSNQNQVKSVYTYKKSARSSMNVISQGMAATIISRSSAHNATSFSHRAPRGGCTSIAIQRGAYAQFTFNGNKSWKMNNLLVARQTKSRYPLWAAHGPTTPKMVENKKVYGVKESEIKQKLYQHIDSRIAELVGG